MGTITAQSIIDKAQIILADTTGVRWVDAELLGWVNDAQREIVLRKPDSYVTNEVVQLTASDTRQTIPAGGIVFIKLTRNMGAAGSTPGRAIQFIDYNILDRENPNWHADTGDGVVQHYAYDPADQKRFYVYPPQPGTATYVEIVYSSAPADVAAIGNAITIDDVYSNAILDYVMFRAYSKDVDYAGNDLRAKTHFELFLSSLQNKEQGESAHEPFVRVNRTTGARAG